MSRRRRHRIKLRSFYVWHRYLGLTVALFALILATTGLALNHTDRLRLDDRHVQLAPLLDWYGIEAPAQATSFSAGGHTLSLLGERLFFDSRMMPGEYGRLIGVAPWHDLLIVAVDEQILLLAPDGELVERLTAKDGVPAGMQAIGTDDRGRITIRAAHGLYQPDDDLLDWLHPERRDIRVRWAQASDLGPERKAALDRRYLAEALPWERVLLDLHSGRILGPAGPWLMDAAAVILILLALSGTFIWLKRSR